MAQATRKRSISPAPTVPETEISQFGYQQELKRSLGLKELTIYGMIFMAPLAPMQVYGMVAQDSFGMSGLVYIVGVLAMLFTPNYVFFRSSWRDQS